MDTAIVWFRNDLRLDDNPALQGAIDSGCAVIPVYVHDVDGEGALAPGAASNAWRERSLERLGEALAERCGPLRFFVGHAAPTLAAVAVASGASAVYWNRRYEPTAAAVEEQVTSALHALGVETRPSNGSLLFEPWDLATRQGGPFRVFAPYMRAALAAWPSIPAWRAPDRWRGTDEGPAGVDLAHLRLGAKRGGSAFLDEWVPGEAGAHDALEAFVDGALADYAVQRDRPDRTGTSRLSPHLHFGEIAPWRVVEEVRRPRAHVAERHRDAFIRQLVWREFAVHLMHHAPRSLDANLDSRFDRFPWETPGGIALDRWRRGRTGIPIIDAGMRELAETGWMHNRVRMLVASFLCKHMRVHWKVGAAWFGEHLVDADPANNALGWQWVAGTGADAAPYFRIFNPVLQGEKFDPEGIYVSRWLPGFDSLPRSLRHAPWRDPATSAQAVPGYPVRPLVDLTEGRNAALLAYRRMRATATGPESSLSET